MSVRSVNLSDIKEAISQALAPIAKPDGIKDDNGNSFKRGIDIMHSKSKPHLLRIRFLTKDDFLVCVDFNCKKMSREYIDNMVEDLSKGLVEHKMQRHQESGITLFNQVRTP